MREKLNPSYSNFQLFNGAMIGHHQHRHRHDIRIFTCIYIYIIYIYSNIYTYIYIYLYSIYIQYINPSKLTQRHLTCRNKVLRHRMPGGLRGSNLQRPLEKVDGSQGEVNGLRE